MKDVLSPETAKHVSYAFFGLIALVYALRFGLADRTRIDVMNWLRSFGHHSG